jgi:hypothetical protein
LIAYGASPGRGKTTTIMWNRFALPPLVLVLALPGSTALAQDDAQGCKDHSLFTRMPGSRIVMCRNADFDAEDFADPATRQKVTVEGRRYSTNT